MKKIKPETGSQNPNNREGVKKADPEPDFPHPDIIPMAPEPHNQSEIEHPTSKINNNSAIGIPHSEIQTKSEIEHPTSKINNNSAIGIPHSEIQTKSEIEHPTSEINNNSAINIPNSATQTTSEIPMEVHHHPEVEKKGIKEYLLEGLMIFIAVMMGFFAESLRENITEGNRAKEYAVTLYSDLKADTTELKGYLAYFKPGVANVDTLIQLLSAGNPEQIPTGKLYWFGLFGGLHRLFTPNDATLLEMENSGSLRFFGDKVISRKLAQYDQLCRDMKANDVNETEIYAEVRKARAQLFDVKYNAAANEIYQETKKTNSTAKLDSFKKSNPPLLSYDKTLFNIYLEMVRSRYLSLKITRADTLMHHADELLGLLNKKYDLEEGH